MNSRKMSIDNFCSRFQDYFCFKYISRKTCKEALCLRNFYNCIQVFRLFNNLCTKCSLRKVLYKDSLHKRR